MNNNINVGANLCVRPNGVSKKSPYGGDSGGLLLLFLFLLLFFLGCKEEGRIDQIDNSASAPAQVTSVTVRNTAGGAVLKYTVPKDENLMYVRAEYEIQPGVVREAKSSFYKDSLVLEGFGDTRSYDVKLFSVGKNEKASEPHMVQVNPLTAPVKVATTRLKESFGGVSVSIENPHRVDLAIILMGDTAQRGYQSLLQTFYTSAERATFVFRGLDSVPGNFSTYLRDRWGNLSDTIGASLTPIYEEFIPRNTWTEVRLPTDAWEPIGGAWYWLYNIFTEDGFFANSDSYAQPHWVTWDLGITVMLSRLKIWMVDQEFTRSNIKKFELYGSMNPNPNGSWDESWIPLGKFEIVKPSSGTSVTNEDIAFAKEGIDFEFENNEFAPDPFVPVRYIRLKVIETWRGPAPRGGVFIQEIRFWGQIRK